MTGDNAQAADIAQTADNAQAADAAQPPKPKVFISYASASRERVGRLARALEAEGFDVWWDHAVNPGEDYRARTEGALAAADSVVVCWSSAAIGSDWVLSEADDARKRDKLVPVRLDACAMPKPFDRIYTIDLPHWSIPRLSPAFHRLVEVLRARSEGREPTPTPWRAKWLSWSNAAITGLTAIALLTNLSDIKQLFEGFTDPTASRRQVEDLTARIDQVQRHLVQNRSLGPSEQLSLRQSLFHLLSAQDGVRRQAAQKAADGDIGGALKVLDDAIGEGEKAAAELAELHADFGALASQDLPLAAIDAYVRSLTLSPGDPGKSLALAALFMRTGKLPEAETELGFILKSPQPVEPRIAAAALAGTGEVRNARGDYRGAQTVLLEALDRVEALGDDWLRAGILLALGQSDHGLGRFASAEDYSRQALDLFEKEGDQVSQASALNNMGTLAIETEQLSKAEDHFRRALQLFETLGDERGRAFALTNFGVIARKRGDFDASDRFYQDAMKRFEAVGDSVGRAQVLSGQGLNSVERRQFDIAEKQMLEALGIYEDAGARANIAIQLQNLAVLSAKRGDAAAAAGYGREALALYREIGKTREANTLASQLRALGVRTD